MSRPLKWFAAIGAILVTSMLVFGCGVMLGSYSSDYGDEHFAAIEDAWRIITEEYVDKDNIDLTALSEAAIKAMMEFIDDPYSSYLDRDAYLESLHSLEGKYEGIGAEVSTIEGQAVIMSVYAGSPAEKAGLEPGDVILAVNGEDVQGLGLMDIVLKVRGPKGTPVTVTVLRSGAGGGFDLTMTRDEVYEKSVALEMIGEYAHIAISQFAEKTDEELGRVLEQLETNGARGIVLDLRYNPGGLLDSVVDSASRFLKEGVVFSVRYSDGREEVYKVRDKKTTTDLPMVVLVNGFSASGSEVVAGALQDHGRALIAGSTTFGKGSVNALTPIGADQGMYITIARWLTPDGHLIEQNGIEPDEYLSIHETEMVGWAIDFLQGASTAAAFDP